MKNSVKEVSIVGQSNNEGKKSQKHEANLQKNSTLYFQIGLILCLLASYALFEMQFKKTAIPIPGETAIVRSISVDYVTPFQIEDNKPKVSEVPPSEELLDKYKEVKDDIPTIETQIIIPEEKKPLTIPSAIESIYGGEEDLTENEDIVIINSVEVVPIYPGCETYKTNIDRKKCMSDKIAKLINRKFNTNLASNHGIIGIQRIYIPNLQLTRMVM